MKYIILIGVGLWVFWKGLNFLLLLFEKEHVRGDLVPKNFEPGEWKSKYLEAKVAEARELNLVYCGSYFTAPQKSLVKGPLLLYRTEKGDAIIALISGRFSATELRKAEVFTRFEDGTAIATGDCFMLPDLTGGIKKQTLHEAPISRLLEVHEQRILESGKSPVVISTEAAFSLLELIEYERGERMVRDGYAKWADPACTSLSRTIKGVLTAERANERERKRVIENTLKERQANG